MDRNVKQGACDEVSFTCKLSHKGKKAKWYIRNQVRSNIHSKINMCFNVDFNSIRCPFFHAFSKSYRNANNSKTFETNKRSNRKQKF